MRAGEDEAVAEREPRRVLQRGLWFEEFEVGTIYDHRPGRTVTEADNVLFTTLTMNTQAAAPGRGVSASAATVPPAAGQLDVHPLHAGRPVGGRS